MPRLPGVNYFQAVRAFEKAGYRIVRQGKHTILSDGRSTIVLPRNNPIDAFTMAGIVIDSGLTIEEFKRLL